MTDNRLPADELEIRLTRERLMREQMRRDGALRWRDTAQTVQERRMADWTIADAQEQIDRIVAWLARREAV